MTIAIVVAAGSGQRFGNAVPKQYCLLDHRTVLRASIEALTAIPLDRIVVVLRDQDPHWPGWEQVNGVPIEVVAGGAERVDSVRNALLALDGKVAPDTPILVHDAARPLVPEDDLKALLEAYEPKHGALLATPVTDTLKREVSGRSKVTQPRRGLWRALTPQMFSLQLLKTALDGADSSTTDEASAVEAIGRQPVLVPGQAINLKITHSQDLDMARRLAGNANGISRTGTGFDVHRFGPGTHVVLGGVCIEHDQGLEAHSDGDVLLHAICDALLGAAALGDIGQHFPPSDTKWAGADSRDLLRACHRLLSEQGSHVVHVDATVICERPKVAPHALAMRTHVAADLELALNQVSIKATTTERLGFTGRGEGIAAMANVTVR